MTLLSDPLGTGQLLELVSFEHDLLPLKPFLQPEFLATLNHGDISRWQQILSQLPEQIPQSTDLKNGIHIGQADNIDSRDLETLTAVAREFTPWRKGPFTLFGLEIDSEWRSDLKWERLLPHISPIANRRVLDVGCGNGYHCLRSAGEEARLVLGLEPYLVYVMQFRLLKQYLHDIPAFVLPLRLDQFPGPYAYFDTVFSMGVIYHQKSPIDHLLQLKNCLAKGGELVLESLIVEGARGYCLTPEKRYARMSNIWFVPSVSTLVSWLERCKFTNIRIVDINTTLPQEQRKTSWMPFESLEDAINPDDPGLTIENLPAPRRAIVVASAR